MAAGEASLIAPPAGPARPSDRRYVLLDVLRYVAAVMVAVMHWGLELEGPYRSLYSIPVVGMVIRRGGLGVPIFFVISGFVILESAARVSSWSAFAFARMTRLFPGLIACMVLVLAVGSHFINPYATPVSSFINSVLLTFTITHVQPLATQLWTLVIELKFYAAIALLLFVVPAAFKSRAGLIAMVVAWQGLILAPVLFPSSSIVGAVAGYWSLETASPFFMLGICVNLAMGLDRALDVMAVPIVLLNTYFVREVFFRRLAGWDAILVAGFGVLIAASTRIRTSDRVRRIARMLGAASYLIYLLHEQLGMAFLMECRKHLAENIQISVVLAVGFVTVVALGVALFVEQPIQRWLKRYAPAR